MSRYIYRLIARTPISLLFVSMLLIGSCDEAWEIPKEPNNSKNDGSKKANTFLVDCQKSKDHKAQKHAITRIAEALNSTKINCKELYDKLSVATELNLTKKPNQKPLKDISILKAFHKLESLNLSLNSISSIPHLDSLIGLKKLELTGNSSYSSLRGIQKLASMDSLLISNTKITSLEPLSGLANLKNLDISHNKNIVDISSLKNIDLTEFKAEGIGLGDKILATEKNCPASSVSQKIKEFCSSISSTFYSQCLKEIDKTENKNLTIIEVLKVLNLGDPSENSCQSAKEELSDPSFTDLDLSNKNLSDVSPLSNLIQLKKINLANNNISNISPLKFLKKLENLDLRDNHIIDLSPLVNHSKISNFQYGILSDKTKKAMGKTHPFTSYHCPFNKNVKSDTLRQFCADRWENGPFVFYCEAYKENQTLPNKTNDEHLMAAFETIKNILKSSKQTSCLLVSGELKTALNKTKILNATPGNEGVKIKSLWPYADIDLIGKNLEKRIEIQHILLEDNDILDEINSNTKLNLKDGLSPLLSLQKNKIYTLTLQRNLNLSNIEELSRFPSLQKLNINNTKVNSLMPLKFLSNVEVNLSGIPSIDPEKCPVDALSKSLKRYCLSIQIN